MLSHGVGYAVLIVALIFNGSAFVPLKYALHTFHHVEDSVFQGWWGIGAAATSLLAIPFNCMLDTQCFAFAPASASAAASATFCATLCVFLAVRHLGVAVEPSVVAVFSVLFSLVEGLVLLDDHVVSATLLTLSLALIAVGAGLVAASKLSAPPHQPSASADVAPSALADDAAAALPTALLAERDPKPSPSRSTSPAFGVCASLFVGAFGSLVPLTTKEAIDVHGQRVPPMRFLGSFGIATLLVTALGVPLRFAVERLAMRTRRAPPPAHPLHIRALAPYGLLSGAMWGAANVFLTLGIQAGINVPVAASMYQAALIVGGLWGVFWFREISGGYSMALFFVGAAALFAGVFLETLTVTPPPQPPDTTNTTTL